MAAILPFVGDQNLFEPTDIAAMSTALDQIIERLKLRDDSDARAVMATRIVDLARAGERDPKRLRDRVLHEANMAEQAGMGAH
jgi:hypothetical protein